MATVYQTFLPEEGQFMNSSFPQYIRMLGAEFPIPGLSYDPAADESAYWQFVAVDYGSGNISVDIFWYADTADTGDVIWEVSVAALSAGTDSQDVETKTFATPATGTGGHLGTTAQRLHRTTISVSDVDSLTAGDVVHMRVRRLGSDVSDTMPGDAVVTSIVASYSNI